jgi:hypothetical protein
MSETKYGQTLLQTESARGRQPNFASTGVGEAKYGKLRLHHSRERGVCFLLVSAARTCEKARPDPKFPSPTYLPPAEIDEKISPLKMKFRLLLVRWFWSLRMWTERFRSLSVGSHRFCPAASRRFASAAPLLVLYAPHPFFLLALIPEFWFDALHAAARHPTFEPDCSTSVRQQRPPPNQTMQLTPGRRTIQLHMSSTLQPAATRALARRS